MESVFEVLQEATAEAKDLQNAKKMQDGQKLAEWLESSIDSLPIEMQTRAIMTARAIRVKGMPDKCLVSTDTKEVIPYIEMLPCTVIFCNHLKPNSMLFTWDYDMPDFSNVGNYVI